MDSQIIDTVSEWETVPVDSGYEGLHRLADDGFSGAVSSGSAWAFVLNGRIIGVFDGDIDAFEGETLTAYRAPDPALSLLYAMRQIGGETQARYYTNETPLSDADDTLSSGGFTGYVELSENVLSGDYYVVYHGGKSMSAAFVGNNERLVTGEEAFERADDEVGIYEVVSVDVSVVELPERDAGAERDADVEGPDADAEAEPTLAETEPEADAGTNPSDAGARADDALAGGERADAADESSVAETPDADDPTDPGPSTSPATDPSAGESAAADDAADAANAPNVARAETPSMDSDSGVAAGESASPATSPTPDAEADASAPAASDGPDASTESGGDRGGDDPFSAEEQWRNARSIPSLDPGESSTTNGASGGAQAAQTQAPPKSSREQKEQKQQRRQQQRQRAKAQRRERRRAKREKRQRQAADGTAADASGGADSSSESGGDEADDLKERLETAEARRDALSAERDELEAERDEYRERAEELEAEVERLRTEVERLQDELEAASGGFVAEDSMSPENALSGTNLFVRYERKGQATLEHARDGQVSRQEVVDNLRLEHHTTFDTGSLAVDGTPYEEFLHESTEYGFAEWVVTDLLYEIGETGNRNALSDLFDALPRIDRVELHGVVGFETEEGVEERSFDVIFRDQMGDPLFVADMNTSRNAASEAMVSSLVGNARAVGESDDALKTAFYVTESFFEPEALEAVAEETGGGFLSRSKKKSFVKLSRKRGFHVCLVEARNNEFHVTVPDL